MWQSKAFVWYRAIYIAWLDCQNLIETLVSCLFIQCTTPLETLFTNWKMGKTYTNKDNVVVEHYTFSGIDTLACYQQLTVL